MVLRWNIRTHWYGIVGRLMELAVYCNVDAMCAWIHISPDVDEFSNVYQVLSAQKLRIKREFLTCLCAVL